MSSIVAVRRFHLSASTLLSAAVFLGSLYAAAQSSSHSRLSGTAPGQVWHMRRVDVTTQVVDLRTHGTRSIQGMTMLVPKEWTFQGQATLPPKFDCNYTIGRFNIATESPDKSTGLQVQVGSSSWTQMRPEN